MRKDKYPSLEHYVEAVIKEEEASAELPVSLLKGVSDDILIKHLQSVTRTPETEHTAYIIACSFIRATVRGERLGIALRLLKIILTYLRDDHADMKDVYVNGVMKSLSLPAILRCQTRFLEHAIKTERETTSEAWIDKEMLEDAALVGKEEGSEITTMLLAANGNSTLIQRAFDSAISRGILWQAKILIAHGANIDRTNETSIREMFGAPKWALKTLAEENAHILPFLFRRYARISTRNPLSYLEECPDWQKAVVMNEIASC
ncbi:MAG: hypothetical protein CMN72_15955 [Sphingomonas sp.]|nr:hypothetical protein [Sphingomonas sp.]|tara:strand:+ start:98 stop:883 length:786 start_codon:yes stop_codon:yes gene_type:complete